MLPCVRLLFHRLLLLWGLLLPLLEGRRPLAPPLLRAPLILVSCPGAFGHKRLPVLGLCWSNPAGNRGLWLGRGQPGGPACHHRL